LTDYTAFGIQVVVYEGDANPLDITREILEISPIKTSALDLNGYVKLEGSILLVGDRTFLETRYNLRWAKGNKVEIRIRNSAGTYVLHRTLRILDNYFDDNPKRPTLELQLGCKFALRESRPPSPGDLKVPALDAPEVNADLSRQRVCLAHCELLAANLRITPNHVSTWRLRAPRKN
jgi:hypothetical protein